MAISTRFKTPFLTVTIVALGYFVDIFDLTLFNMVRRQSLLDLGVQDSNLVSYGLILLNIQMVGMLLGGFLWGYLGDKKGRLPSLFASILIYSLANILNAFVTDLPSYGLLRFIAGIGLAGELGLGVTLVTELLSTKSRGLGTSIIASCGVLGAVTAGIFVEIFSWRTCYLIGGFLGLALLFSRFLLSESPFFLRAQKNKKIQTHHFFFFFKKFFNKLLLLKKISLCTLVGLPIWYIGGLVMPFTPELALELGVTDPILSSRAIAISYLGLALGDFLSGLTSQYFKSRKKAFYLFEVLAFIFVCLLFTTTIGHGQFYFYTLCFFLGMGAGFWALLVTISAESFGTNIRSTTATVIPNFVRASILPMSLLLSLFKKFLSHSQGTLALGFLVFALCFISTFFLKETFYQDLDFYE
jgi:MFS transporter, putative metabolite:H+ symporter